MLTCSSRSAALIWDDLGRDGVALGVGSEDQISWWFVGYQDFWRHVGCLVVIFWWHYSGAWLPAAGHTRRRGQGFERRELVEEWWKTSWAFLQLRIKTMLFYGDLSRLMDMFHDFHAFSRWLARQSSEKTTRCNTRLVPRGFVWWIPGSSTPGRVPIRIRSSGDIFG